MSLPAPRRYNQASASKLTAQTKNITPEKERIDRLLNKLERQIDHSREIREDTQVLFREHGINVSSLQEPLSHFSRQPASRMRPSNFGSIGGNERCMSAPSSHFKKVVHSQQAWNADRTRRINEGINTLASAYSHRRHNDQYFKNFF